MKNICGIYMITCKVNGRVYIGSSINLRKRKNNHFHLLRKNKHPNSILQNSYNKYGEDNMVFSLVVECKPETLLLEEERYIKYFKSYGSGFNLIETPTKNMLGYKHSIENRSKLSKIKKQIGRVSGSLNAEQVKQMRRMFFEGERITTLSAIFKIHRKTVRECVYLKTYQDILCDIPGYKDMLAKLSESRKEGKRPHSRGWKHKKEFIDKFTEAVSKPRPQHIRVLTPEQVRTIRLRAECGETYKVLALEFGVNQNSISRIVRKLTYKDIE